MGIAASSIIPPVYGYVYPGTASYVAGPVGKFNMTIDVYTNTGLTPPSGSGSMSGMSNNGVAGYYSGGITKTGNMDRPVSAIKINSVTIA